MCDNICENIVFIHMNDLKLFMVGRWHLFISFKWVIKEISSRNKYNKIFSILLLGYDSVNFRIKPLGGYLDFIIYSGHSDSETVCEILHWDLHRQLQVFFVHTSTQRRSVCPRFQVIKIQIIRVFRASPALSVKDQTGTLRVKALFWSIKSQLYSRYPPWNRQK